MHIAPCALQVVIAGYPNMGNITVTAGKELLNQLAEDSDEADQFRRFVLSRSTTYFGESNDWCGSASVEITHAPHGPAPRRVDRL